MAMRLRLFLIAAVLLSPAAANAQTSSVSTQQLGVAPPIPVKPLEILDTDYPLQALLINEEGRTGLNLLIDPAGKVTLAQIAKTSGSRWLDRQAVRVATAHWSFAPLSGEGAAIARELQVDIAWKLPLRPADEFRVRRLRPRPPIAAVRPGEVRARIVIYDDPPERNSRTSRDQPQPVCYSRPELVSLPLRSGKAAENSIQVRQWFHVAPGGDVDDVLVQTQKGWMHLSAPLVDAATFSLPAKAATANPADQACWYRTEFSLSAS